MGVDYVGGQSDYDQRLRGLGLYTTFDFKPHFGAEFELNQGDMPLYSQYERSYEIGGRYHRTYGRVSPYAKVMIGRGVFNFPKTGTSSPPNLAYNMFSLGAGADVRITRYLNARGNFEFQDWHNFPPRGLDPKIFTIGVAYHFPGGLGRGRHY